MPDVLSADILAVLLLAAFLVGIVNATFGIGGSLLAYPLLSFWFPGKAIIGILSIIVIVATAHRLILYREHLSKKTVLYFLVLGVPFSVAGAYALACISVGLLQMVVGIFLVGMTLYEWIVETNKLEDEKTKRAGGPPKYLIGVGAVSGFLTGLIGSAGFINTAFLLRVGFLKEGISVNQAGIAFAYSLIKVPVYWRYEILTPSIVVAGLLGSIGSVAGTFWGAYLLRRLSIERFKLILRLIILAAGANLIFNRP
jgi:uncharacterized membrane protein YfcA